jgi:hypothetical protein
MNRKHAIALGVMGIALGGLVYSTRTTEDGLRKKVVNAALAERKAPNPTKYWNDVLVDPSSKPKEWCGGFALWAIHQAKLGLDVSWKIGTGFLGHLRLLKGGELPKPGDIAYFAKNQHQAIVKEVNGNTVTLINGNAEGGSISVSSKPLSAVTAFYSLSPLLAKVL